MKPQNHSALPESLAVVVAIHSWRRPKDEGDRQVANVPANLLDRQFVAERPNQKWIADFTYIWTVEG